ncbi:MAG: hypothetical protein JO202_10065 [Ktedonobacteraceae bacterium]|nr:hypothetical protein [Ktedonobacteraceae bacterium]
MQQENDMVEDDQSLIELPTDQGHSVEVAGALSVRLHRLDLARHVAIAPDGKRYVVATYNDTHMGRGYVTAVMPQQSDYLTLIRLAVCEINSDTAQEAVQQHIAFVQTIQQGKLDESVRSLPQASKL